MLLEFDATVHGDQSIVRALHPPQQLTVRDARPAPANHRVDTVALKRCGEIYWKLLVKKNAHQPAA